MNTKQEREQKRPNILIFTISGLNDEIFKKDFSDLLNKEQIETNGLIQFNNLISKENNFLHAYMSYEDKSLFSNYHTLDLSDAKNYIAMKSIYGYLYGPNFKQPEIFFLKNFDKIETSEIKKDLLMQSNESAPIIVHYFIRTQLHLPFIDMCPGDSGNYISKYKENYLAHPERLFLLEYLFPRDELYKQMISSLAHKYPKLKISTTILRKNYSANFYNSEMIKKWQQSPSFIEDLNYVKSRYECSVKKIVLPFITESLKGFGISKIFKNSVILITGDHGESFGQKNIFTHSLGVNEQSIKVPLLVKFPILMKYSVNLNQVSHFGLAELIRWIASDQSLNMENINEFISSKMTEDYILSNNCAKNQFSVRWKNEFKLIYYSQLSDYQLFNLKLDPNETTDIQDANHAVFSDLKNYFLKNIETRLNSPDSFICGFPAL